MHRFRLFALVFFLAIIPTLASAQDDEQPPHTFDLTFPGGTPQELANAISKAYGSHVNIIIPNSGREVQLPPVQVTSVTVGSLLSSLRENERLKGRSLSTSSEFHVSAYGFRPVETINQHSPQTLKGSDPVWVMDVETHRINPARVEVKPINIAHLLTKYSIDDISTAIHLAWDASEDRSIEPEIKYHPETKLIIVSGTIGHILLAEQILHILSPPKARDAAPSEDSES